MSEFDAEQAQAREDLCRFLSACFYEPGVEFNEERLFDSMLAAASRTAPELAAAARRLGEAFAAQDLQSLLVDYTRLFLGPMQTLASPYGSFWLTGEASLLQQSTLAVPDLYRQGGFDIDQEFHELPDHIAVELEFLYLLIHHQNEARRSGDGAKAADSAALKQRFLAQHLGAWIGPFAAAVQAGAQTDFYRELGGFAEQFVRSEERRSSASH